MGNCQCENNQVQIQEQNNKITIPFSYLVLIKSLHKKFESQNNKENQLENSLVHLKEFPLQFEPLVSPCLKLKEFLYLIQDLNNLPQISQEFVFDNQKAIYYGQFSAQQKTGSGVLFFQNGTFYQGNFLQNKISGLGRYVDLNGSVLEGNWNEGFLTGESNVKTKELSLKGNFVKGSLEGTGEEILYGIYIYQGEFLANKKHGKGKIQFNNGDVFEGNFINDQMEGKGHLVFSNGDSYEGSFHENWYDGKGKYFFKDGSQFEGFFQIGFRHGKGIQFNSKKEF